MRTANLCKFSILTLVVLGITACGSGSGSGSGTGNQTVSIPVEIKLFEGDTITVSSGDRLSAADENTRIKIKHTLEDGSKLVTLLSGKATLTRANDIF